MQQHVHSIATELEVYHRESSRTSDATELLRGWIKVYLTPKKATRARHVVALHDMRYLTDEQRKSSESTLFFW